MTALSKIKPWDQRLASFLVDPFVETALHPNHLTTATLILGQSTALLFILKGETLAWLAALLYMFAVFSDHMDGELARMSGKTSDIGHHYDYVVGGINYTTLFISIGYTLSSNGNVWLFILGMMAGLSNPLILIMRMKMEQQYGNKAVAHPSFAGFEIEDGIYLIGPLTWFAGIHFFFIPYALGTLGYFAWTIFEYRQWNKDG